MISVTLNFSSTQEMLAYFGTPNERIPNATQAADEKKPATAAPSRPTATVADAPAPTESAPAPAAASAEVPAPASTVATEAPATVDYKTLQAAVFALAKESRDAAKSVAQSFGVNTFKELDQARWPEALKAVNDKIAELAA